MGFLKSYGFETADADAVARQVVSPSSVEGRDLLQKIAHQFGSGLVDKHGELNRLRLREIISKDSSKRDELERLLHPLIIRELDRLQEQWKARNCPVAFVEGTRLVESGHVDKLEGCILVSAEEALRLRRVMERDGARPEDVLKMFRLQDEARMRGASKIVWPNESKPEELRKHVEAFLADHGFSRYRK